MEKITINPSPVGDVTQVTDSVEYVQAGEMRIGLKKPNVIAQYRLVEVAGDSAANSTYMHMISFVIWLWEIDGEKIAQPQNKMQLEALIQQVGDEGLAAIFAYFETKAKAAAETSKVAADAIKN